ncbi:hypothetical protein KP509_38G022200 [Ceratopteris richardii]|uniref:Uncharacterized protein n=1 Tax=Ceratopteris richardii TaxID=49495 RepID=A0A8T2Q2V7_CERRI|nr:hypothetical protein KP509_38G022200 [Ceratopteris richardii]
MDAMPIKRTRVQDRDRSEDEDSSMGTQSKKGRVAEGEASKRKRRPRRKIMMEDFPLGKGIEPYDLIEDISTQKPNITWPQLLQLSSKTRREWSKLVSTMRAKNKEINLIRANAYQKWGFGLLVLKPNDRTKSVTYDLKDQKKEDHRYETTMDEESSCYDSDSSSEEWTTKNDSSTLKVMGVIFQGKEDGGKEDDLRQPQSMIESFQPRWEGPFLIKTKFKNGSYQLMDMSGKLHKTKINGWRLKKYWQRIEESNEQREQSREKDISVVLQEDDPPWNINKLFEG